MKNKLSKTTLAWVNKAEDDFSFAKDTLKETKYYDHICYLSHQTTEKYLKAYLIKSKGEITKKEKTHDLVKLASQCKSLGLNLEKYRVQLRTLSEFYMPSKYPDAAFGKFTKKDAKDSFSMAEKIIEAIKEKLF